MSNLSTADRDYLENALRLDRGGIVRFNEESFTKFFSECGININASKYTENGKSMSERMQSFWNVEDNKTVGRVVLEIASLFRNVELRGFITIKYSIEIEKIGNKLLNTPDLCKNYHCISDDGFNKLFEQSQKLYEEGSRQEALEKMWDAFERIKTIWSLKPEFSDVLAQNGSNLRKDDLDAELKILTKIGNDYQIRHFETNKIKITNDEDKEYLYHRMLSFLNYCIAIMNSSEKS